MAAVFPERNVVVVPCLLLIFLLFCPSIVFAHNIEHTACEIQIDVSSAPRIEVEYHARISPAKIVLLTPGWDQKRFLSQKEVDRVGAEVAEIVHERLAATVDEAPLVFEMTRHTLSQSEEAFTAIIHLTSNAGFSNAGLHRFFITELGSHAGAADVDFLIAASDNVGQIKRSTERNAVAFEFTCVTSGSGAAAVKQPGSPDDTSVLQGFMHTNSWTTWTLAIAFMTALLLGAGHALSPGHGKAMVAAYLVGSKGTVRDAVVLGTVVTFTHVFSVIVVGLIALSLSEFVLPSTLYSWTGVASGAIVFVVGYWLIARRALGAKVGHHHHGDHSHTHDHKHDHHDHAYDEGHSHDHPKDHDHSHDDAHDHSHSHSPGHGHSHSHVPTRPGWRGLLSMGIAGGIVPCPTAMVVLLISIALHKILLGLSLIVVFSAGLAAVLILIGVLTVCAQKNFLNFFSEKRRWIHALPVFSSGVIMVVGLFIVFRALLDAGVLR